MKNFVAAIVSALLTSVVLGNAYYQKKQFYPAVVFLTKSNPSMAVIYFQIFTFVLFLNKLVRQIFFGELRAIEFEHLMERSWYTVPETCLTFTVFRDDFSPNFVALLMLLLFLKSFHWLAEDRVEYMERSPVISVIFHIRVLSSLLLLGTIDLFFVKQGYHYTLENGASIQMIFGFEYTVLFLTITNIAIKYTLHSFDLYNENPWEKKATFLLYTELIIGFLKINLCMVFVCTMIKKYTLPLFAFRPMYRTIRNFKRALKDIILSRQAIRNMNTLYPDATPEELEAVDNVCIICREDMSSSAKKLPCNHIFHIVCLTSWFQRQQTCPTCRLNILEDTANVNPQRQENQQPNPAHAPQDPPSSPPRSQHPPQNASSQFHWQGTPPGTSQATHDVGPFFIPNFSFSSDSSSLPTGTEDLSDEALRLLENNLRDGVKARLECLKNMKRLIDSSVVLMQQYNEALEVANRNCPSSSSEHSSASNLDAPSTS